MLPTRHVVAHLGIKRTVILVLIVFFALQFLAREALSAVATSPIKRYKIRQESRIAEQKVPTLSELASNYVHQGLRYYEHGRWQEATVAFKDAIEIKPNYAVAYYGLAVTYSRLEIWEEALTFFERTVELSPGHAQGYLGLGITYNMLGLDTEAMKALKEAVRINPRFAEAHYALALNYLKLGDITSALKIHKILITLDPNLADQLINLIK